MHPACSRRYFILYVIGVQGRPQAFEKLTIRDYSEASRDGDDAASRRFKTVTNYGYQILAFTGFGEQMVKAYLSIRDIVVGRRVESGIPMPRSNKNFFLVTLSGHKPVRVGRRITDFFEKTLGIHIDTNTLRKVVECEMEEAFNQGRITQHERQAVMKASGHSEATVRKFYTPRKRCCYHFPHSITYQVLCIYIVIFFTVSPIQSRKLGYCY